MLNIITKEVPIDEELQSKIQFICDFCNVKPIFINGSIRKIEKTNINYIEPNKIIIKSTTFLAFNHNKEVYVENLQKRINISDLQEYIKAMINYQDTKDLIEKNQKNLKIINNNSIELDKDTINIKDKILNLKKASLKKDTYILSKEDKKILENYIDKIDKTNNEYKKINGLSSSLNSLNQTIKEDKKAIKVLTENNKALELRVKNLTFKTENQEELISDLKQDNFNLKYRLQQLEDFFKKLVNLFKRMIKKDSKKESYLEVLKDMHNNRIISDNTLDDILNSKNNIKEKEAPNIVVGKKITDTFLKTNYSV